MRAYKLGNYFFAAQNEAQDEAFALGRMFQRVDVGSAASVEVLNLDDNASIAPWPDHNQYVYEQDVIRMIIMRAMKSQEQHVWIDAAVLLTDSNKLVMLTGESHSGKTTTTLALSLALGWKIVTEDIALLDMHSGQMLTLVTPLSIREGTLNSVREIAECNNLTPLMVREKWLPMVQKYCSFDPQIRFDAIFHLSHIDRAVLEALQCTELPAVAYLRKILPNSNLLVVDQMDKFAEYLGAVRCEYVRGGSLAERVNLIASRLR